jgi:hypothetical protein
MLDFAFGLFYRYGVLARSPVLWGEPDIPSWKIGETLNKGRCLETLTHMRIEPTTPHKTGDLARTPYL